MSIQFNVFINALAIIIILSFSVTVDTVKVVTIKLLYLIFVIIITDYFIILATVDIINVIIFIM